MTADQQTAEEALRAAARTLADLGAAVTVQVAVDGVCRTWWVDPLTNEDGARVMAPRRLIVRHFVGDHVQEVLARDWHDAKLLADRRRGDIEVVYGVRPWPRDR